MAAPRPTLWYAFVRGLLKHTAFRLTGGLRFHGRDLIPVDGPVILAPNHLSEVDPPVVACAMRRPLRFLAKESLFRVPVLGPIITSLGAFPVRRGEGDTEAIRRSLEVLEAGHVLLVFPEGTRGDGVHLGAINRGVAMMAKRTGAQVLPAAIINSHKVLPRGGKFGRARVKVAFGEPFRYADIPEGRNERETRDRFSEELARRILALCEQHGMPLRPSGASTEAPKPTAIER